MLVSFDIMLSGETRNSVKMPRSKVFLVESDKLDNKRYLRVFLFNRHYLNGENTAKKLKIRRRFVRTC